VRFEIVPIELELLMDFSKTAWIASDVQQVPAWHGRSRAPQRFGPHGRLCLVWLASPTPGAGEGLFPQSAAPQEVEVERGPRP